MGSMSKHWHGSMGEEFAEKRLGGAPMFASGGDGNARLFHGTLAWSSEHSAVVFSQRRAVLSRPGEFVIPRLSADAETHPPDLGPPSFLFLARLVDCGHYPFGDPHIEKWRRHHVPNLCLCRTVFCGFWAAQDGE